MARIPKLGSQWRIIHDFKPTEYLQAANPATKSLFLESGDGQTPGSIRVGIYFFPLPKIAPVHIIRGDNNQPQGKYIVKSTQLPKVGEWTRVEIGHEKVDEKYFISLSVGGRKARKEVTDPELRKLTDVQVCIGDEIQEHSQPGIIRRLVVLEKR